MDGALERGGGGGGEEEARLEVQLHTDSAICFILFNFILTGSISLLVCVCVCVCVSVLIYSCEMSPASSAQRPRSSSPHS